jgi:hypothetical protein
MKSLGLNYTFQTLIVIDKTPVARTNAGRLAPLQGGPSKSSAREGFTIDEAEGEKRERKKKKTIFFGGGFSVMHLSLLNCFAGCFT